MLELGYTPKDLADFGNFHFGIVANGLGVNLESSIVGAGAYQVYFQEGGSFTQHWFASNIWAITLGCHLLPNSWTIYGVKYGITAGDRSDDSIVIVKGWCYAENNF